MQNLEKLNSHKALSKFYGFQFFIFSELQNFTNLKNFKTFKEPPKKFIAMSESLHEKLFMCSYLYPREMKKFRFL